MSNEVMKKDTGSVALFGNDLQKGFENMTQEDMALPFVRILGQLSVECWTGPFSGFPLKSTFYSINGHPKQYILVDTIFNYRFHFGLPGKYLYLSRQNTPLCLRRSRRQKDVFSELF